MQLFLEISELEQDSRKIELLRSKTIEFVQDITDLNVLASAQKQGAKNNSFNKDDNAGSQNLGRLVRTADFYLESALAEDERGKHDESTLQLYQQAAGFYLDAIRLSSGDENLRKKYSVRLSGITCHELRQSRKL